MVNVLSSRLPLSLSKPWVNAEVIPTVRLPVQMLRRVPKFGVAQAAATVLVAGYAALVRVSMPLKSSVKLTLTFTFLP